MGCELSPSSPPGHPSTRPVAKSCFLSRFFSIPSSLFQVPYPASPLFATLTKTAGNSHCGTQRPPDHWHHSLSPTPYPLSFHILAHSFALFCTQQKLKSFLFTRFRTLCQKTTRGGGTPLITRGQNETTNCQSRRLSLRYARRTSGGRQAISVGTTERKAPASSKIRGWAAEK